MSKLSSGSRRKQAAPMNILVIGRCDAGKSTFIKTLLATVARDEQQNNRGSSHNISLNSQAAGEAVDAGELAHGLKSNSVAAASAFENAALANLTFPGFEDFSISASHEVSKTAGRTPGSRLRVTIIDTPGLATEQDVSRIGAFLMRSYDMALAEELKVRRDARSAYATLIHAAIYLMPARAPPQATAVLTPSQTQWERELRFDVDAMRLLAQFVNVVPVVSRCDMLTVRQHAELKRRLTGFCDFTVFLAPFTEEVEVEVEVEVKVKVKNTDKDKVEAQEDQVGQKHTASLDNKPSPQLSNNSKGAARKMADSAVGLASDSYDDLPFSVFGGEFPTGTGNDDRASMPSLIMAPGTRDQQQQQQEHGKAAAVVGRTYAWGTIDVDQYSDLPKLRRLLFGPGAEGMMEHTRDVLYEGYRSSRLTMRKGD